MNVENHFNLIDDCIKEYKFDIPKHLVCDLRQDIILRLLTKPKPDERYTDESWVKIVSGGIITNFRIREKKYIPDYIDKHPISIRNSSTLLSIELNCDETELEVAKMVYAGHTYKDIATSFGIVGNNSTGRNWVYRILKSIKNKIKER